MNKLFVATLIVLAPLAAGCSDPCGDLEENCGCVAANFKPGCDTTVALDDSDLCEVALDSGVYNCP